VTAEELVMSGTPSGSPDKWQARNNYHISKTRSLARDMLRSVQANEAQERASKDAATEEAAREKQRLRDDVFAKASMHGEVITTASKCMRDIEDATLQTDNSLAQLRQERALSFAALQVCKRRIQEREKRPKPELIQDDVADALDSEKKLLETAREDYLQMESDGKKLGDDLRKTRNSLSEDTGGRRLVMKHDQQSLKPNVNNPNNIIQPRQPPSVCEGQSRILLDDTFQLLERASQHRQKSIALIFRSKDEARKAVTLTEDCLEKHTDALAHLEKTLKEQMAAADNAISYAERSLDRSDRRLDPNDSEKKEKLLRDRQLLDQLVKQREVIHQEALHKLSALDIDNRCRRITPVQACHDPEKLSLTPTRSAPNLLAVSGGSNADRKKGPWGNGGSLSAAEYPMQKDKKFGNSSFKTSANAQMGLAKR